MSAWTKLNPVDSSQPSLVNWIILSETLHESKEHCGTWVTVATCNGDLNLSFFLKPEIEKMGTKQVKVSIGTKVPRYTAMGVGQAAADRCWREFCIKMIPVRLCYSFFFMTPTIGVTRYKIVVCTLHWFKSYHNHPSPEKWNNVSEANVRMHNWDGWPAAACTSPYHYWFSSRPSWWDLALKNDQWNWFQSMHWLQTLTWRSSGIRLLQPSSKACPTSLKTDEWAVSTDKFSAIRSFPGNPFQVRGHTR